LYHYDDYDFDDDDEGDFYDLKINSRFKTEK